MSASSNRRAGAALTHVYLGANALVQFLYVPLLLSGIGQDEYGLYQLVGSIMSYVVSISGVLSSGVGRYYCMYKAEGDEERMENTLAIAKRLYWGISAVAFVVVLVLIPAVRSVYSASFTAEQVDECSLMLVLLAVNMVVSLNNAINNAAITANERFIFLKVVQLVTLIVQPLLVVGLIQVWGRASIVCAVTLAMNVVSATAQRVYARGFLEVKYTYHGLDRGLVKGLFTFSGAIVLVTFADQVFWKADQLIIGYMFDAGAVAVYSIGSSLFSNLMPFGTAVSSVFLPRVSELYHRDHDMGAISDLFVKVGRLSFLVCSFIVGGFAVIGRDFVRLWAGEGYGESFWIALVVMVPLMVDLIQNLGLTIMQVEDRYYFRGVVYAGIAVLNVALTVVLLRAVGLVGAAISTGVCMLVGNGFVMNWYYARRIGLDIGRFWREVGRMAVPILFVVLACAVAYEWLLAGTSSWAALAGAGVGYSVVFLAVAYLISMNEYEKELVCGALKRLGAGGPN